MAFIGLAAPEHYYIRFFDKYLNYPSWLRWSLLTGSQGMLKLLGYESYRPDKFLLVLKSGAGVKLGYSCLGYGVMSFWVAFVFANKGGWQRKTKWITGGLLAIWLINIFRISFLIIANSRHIGMPFGLDHHTWFNILAYIMIFVLIYFYARLTNSQIKAHDFQVN